MFKRRQWVYAFLAILLLGCGVLFLWHTGFFAALSSPDSMGSYINRFSPYGQCFFFLIQFLSVILAPIPSNITALAGSVLFGMWQSFFLTYAAVILGSFLIFYLARVLGRPFADRLVGRKVSEKYLDVIRAKQDIFLFLIFLLPFFPDDLICILAGLTAIRPLRFLIIALIGRPWGLLVACAVGSAAVSIPLWGMVLLGLGGIALLLVCLKFGDRWAHWLLQKIKRR